MINWLTLDGHERWLESETDRLLDFGRRSAVPQGGFVRQDDEGAPSDLRAELWITCRMTHVYALGHLMGRPGCGPLVDHGLRALEGGFADSAFGGWFAAIESDGEASATAKAAYPHAFVILAASSALAADRPGAGALLVRALDISERYFWDDVEGLVVEEWDRSFEHLGSYRGVNANMHTVEAYLAAADVLRERRWLDRAVRILTRVVHGFARRNSWRIPEHFDEYWTPDLEYNRDTPSDPFRPYGATVGHAFEWARLTVQAREALAACGDVPPGWMLDDALALFERGVADGWAVDGTDGFVYTTDWDGAPVVRERMHWVAAEAASAAAVLHAVTGDALYAGRYSTWWDYIATHLIDRSGGSWWHELAPDHSVSRTVWAGKADLYHAVQATLIPRLPVTPALAPALRAGLSR